MPQELPRSGVTALLAALLAGVVGCGADPSLLEDLPPTPEITLRDLGGFWYDIAHLPQSWSSDCSNTVVAFSPASEEANETFTAISCTIPGGGLLLQGELRVTDLERAAFKLTLDSKKRDFSLALRVHAVGPEGAWILVGSPKRDLLWLLARQAFWTEDEIFAVISLVAPTYGLSQIAPDIQRTKHLR